MALNINTNIGALGAAAAASSANRTMESAMERLSTGLRINTAADDAAGMAISSRMEAQIRGLSMAIRNAADGQSLIDTTEGAHNEVMNILQRMRELAVQSANDTNVAGDRNSLQAEITQLIAEINRISSQTTWNGVAVLDGTFTGKQFQIGADDGQTVSVSVNSVAAASIGAYEFEAVGMLKIDAADTDVSPAATGVSYTVEGPKGTTTVTIGNSKSAKEVAASFNAATTATGVSASAVNHVRISANPTVTGGGATPNVVAGGTTVTMNINGTAIASSLITETDMRALKDSINSKSGITGVTAEMGSTNADIILKDADGDDINIDNFVSGDNATILFVGSLKADGVTAAGSIAADATDEVGHVGILKDDSVAGFAQAYFTGSVSLTANGAFTVTGGDTLSAAETDQPHFQAAAASGSLTTIGAVNIATAAGSASAMRAIDGAIGMINSARGDLGAISNRLDNTISNLTNISTNISASQSRIQDADFAAESTNLAKAQILQQAATAMLAQANASKQGVLSLLQG